MADLTLKDVLDALNTLIDITLKHADHLAKLTYRIAHMSDETLIVNPMIPYGAARGDEDEFNKTLRETTDKVVSLKDFLSKTTTGG